MVQAISEIEDHGDGLRPIIVDFQNSELRESEQRAMQTGIYQSRDQTLVALATNKVLYTGEVSKVDDAKESCNRFLLISNRRTGKVRLVAVDSAKVTPQCASESQSTDTLDSSVVNYDASINELNKQFGSKKTKSQIRQKELRKTNIEQVKEQLEQTVAAVNISDLEQPAALSGENDSNYRPPINRNAATKEQVYTLHDLVPEYVLDSLEEKATEVLSSDLEKLDLTPFIKSKLYELQSSSADNVIYRAELFLYIDYLMKFKMKLAKSITKKCVICDCSTEVNSHILDNFSVLSGAIRTRPLSMKDKITCYVLVLSMIAFNYELDVEAVSKDVKLGLKKVQDICRILAFSSSAKSKNLMVLKIPLPPAVSASQRKRKR